MGFCPNLHLGQLIQVANSHTIVATLLKLTSAVLNLQVERVRSLFMCNSGCTDMRYLLHPVQRVRLWVTAAGTTPALSRKALLTLSLQNYSDCWLVSLLYNTISPRMTTANRVSVHRPKTIGDRPSCQNAAMALKYSLHPNYPLNNPSRLGLEHLAGHAHGSIVLTSLAVRSVGRGNNG
jgi:hypothetical protein